jgi:hypothetical protein
MLLLKRVLSGLIGYYKMETQAENFSGSYFLQDQNSIIISLSTPQSKPKRVTVSKHETVSILLSLLPPGRKTIFSEGSVIDQNKSFHELGIKQFSRVVIINEDNLSFKQEMFWKRATKNDTELSEQHQNMKNSHARRDLSRMIDLKIIQIENNTKHKRRMIELNAMMKREESMEQQTNTVTEYENKINENPLPILW